MQEAAWMSFQNDLQIKFTNHRERPFESGRTEKIMQCTIPRNVIEFESCLTIKQIFNCILRTVTEGRFGFFGNERASVPTHNGSLKIKRSKMCATVMAHRKLVNINNDKMTGREVKRGKRNENMQQNSFFFQIFENASLEAIYLFIV